MSSIYNPFENDAPPEDFDFQPEEEENEVDYEAMYLGQIESAPTQSQTLNEKQAHKRMLEDIEPDDNFLMDSNEFDLDEPEKENVQPIEKRPRLDLPTAENPSQSQVFERHRFVSGPISDNLPTLNKIEEVNIEVKLQQAKAKHTQMRLQFLKHQESQKLSTQMLESQNLGPNYQNFTKVLMVEPMNADSCQIKKSDGVDFQFFLRKKDAKQLEDNHEIKNLKQQSSLSSGNLYADFKKLKFSSLKMMANKNKLIKNQQNQPTSTKKLKSADLLVQKFAPNHFTSLLSDTTTNRIFLKWMQLWDHVVFNKPKLKKPESKEPEEAAFSNSNFRTNKTFEKNKKFDKHNYREGLMSFERALLRGRFRKGVPKIASPQNTPQISHALKAHQNLPVVSSKFQ